ncbi:hypothetical protein Ccrd_014853 [Cynara cardunculus var. scolymus]|uniref:Uncharacterized protein n=1 Tax=Cynara cardunculus var. scolymus TaxID=59895 RepID=A0A103YCX6_CYNCS|nr:hypothetical protein Ccrd_014853 [Cynara cardunculus var. scolymus]
MRSVKATVLDSNLNIVYTEVVNFDSELPRYKTKDGVSRDPAINGRIVSSTLILQNSKKLPLEKMAAVSGSAQQHGSVYWKRGSLGILSSLDPNRPLVHQFEDAFSTNESPVWMVNSTTKQCNAIDKALGGAFEHKPQVYGNTERISLVSSFMASILIGGYACIDHTDGAGMNLMISRATTPCLEEKLGKLAPAHAVAGLIAPYYVERLVKLPGLREGDLPVTELPLSSTMSRWQSALGSSQSSVASTPRFKAMDIASQPDSRCPCLAPLPKDNLSTRGHTEKCRMPSPLERIIAMGGASINHAIFSSMASIFGCNVYTAQRPGKIFCYGLCGYVKRRVYPQRYYVELHYGQLMGCCVIKKVGFFPIPCMYKDKLEKTGLGCKLDVIMNDVELVTKYAIMVKKRMEIENWLVEYFVCRGDERYLFL